MLDGPTIAKTKRGQEEKKHEAELILGFLPFVCFVLLFFSSSFLSTQLSVTTKENKTRPTSTASADGGLTRPHVSIASPLLSSLLSLLYSRASLALFSTSSTPLALARVLRLPRLVFWSSPSPGSLLLPLLLLLHHSCCAATHAHVSQEPNGTLSYPF